jgi:signal peptidase II
VKIFPIKIAAAFVVFAFVLDQWTKYAITSNLRYGESVEITSFFNLVLVYNRGAAFSFLSEAGGWQRIFFIVLTVVAVAVMTWLIRKHRDERLFCWSLTLIIAGALGNLVDRVRFGHVIDFLDFHLAGWHFWAFNVADSAITLGAILMFIDAFKPRPETTT